MIYIDTLISQTLSTAIFELYKVSIDQDSIQIQETRKEFEGDKTIVVFPFVRIAKQSPQQTAQEIGTYLQQNI